MSTSTPTTTVMTIPTRAVNTTACVQPALGLGEAACNVTAPGAPWTVIQVKQKP